MEKSKNILGLDLGTNSIGWALIEMKKEFEDGKIQGLGSRIIPMDGAILGDFERGNSVSQTAERTRLRSTRRLRERHLLRRERLHRVLNILGFLPTHYAQEIDFEKRLGKFKDEKEPKIAWKTNSSGKFEFIFKSSFDEMAGEFNQKIPYDWTIYYLRKKALSNAISKEELAWLILNFNQKRGYNQLRGEEDDDNQNIREFVATLKITSVEKGETDKKNNKRTWYKIGLSNGWEYNATFTTQPNWLNTEKDFLITEEIDDDGNIKIVKDKKSDTSGKEKRKISPLPTFDEINLMSKADQDKIYSKIKARTETTINNSGTTVGAYIYNSLVKNPTQKLNGKLVRTIERKYYKDELIKILKKQIELQPELFSEEKYADCVRELYRSNDTHQFILSKKDFIHLLVEDIIFYQRPLRSQKSLISNCSLEFSEHRINKKDEQGKTLKNVFETDINGNIKLVKEYLKATPKSNPYYQEFRLWQWIKNLAIYRKSDAQEINVTNEFINSIEDLEHLFEALNKRKEIEQKQLLKILIERKWKLQNSTYKSKELNAEIEKHRWNYVEDKKYPCNTTLALIIGKLEKVGDKTAKLSDEAIYHLWHIIYSVNDKNEFEAALETYAKKHALYYIPKAQRNAANPDKKCFVYNFKNIPPFKSEYGSYSEKAIKKLLPLMRVGKYWSWDAISNCTKEKIDKLLTGEFDESIQNRVRDKSINLTEKDHFQNLPEWLAKYIVYNRHSESADTAQWRTINELETYLQTFKQHSLRNPIVEQVVLETLRVVKDIWQHYGFGAEGYFDEIHLELGREMKNTADDRKRLSTTVTENENTNIRIKALLMEMLNDSNYENVRPHSPMQQDILKIYENYAINTEEKFVGKGSDGKDKFEFDQVPEDILKISKAAEPTKSDLIRYKLWLEQRYRSPYTGQMIPLNKLFTSAYEIEHIIPQSRYFDDSLSNKVICEMAVNKLKDKQLGFEFIKKHHGEKVPTGYNNETVEIFSEESYLDFVNKNYNNNRGKRNKLLLDEIPEKMIERQLNDTRYISKFISSLLSNLVRETNNDDGLNSKNLIACNGTISSKLRQDWGLNDVWNDIILPRFERMNQLTNSENFTTINKEGHKIPTVPFELSKGFQKKRIDHRHHALDALVVACTSRDHVNLLNNQSAQSDNKRIDLQNKLRHISNWVDDKGIERKSFQAFKMPWTNFPSTAKEAISGVIVSFKQNIRIINKATNKYEKIENGKKVKTEQSGTNWAIRKPMHKDTVSGKVELPRIKVPKGKILTATRKTVDISFDEKTIQSITDTGIQKILLNYLKAKGNAPEIAFTPEGLDELNKNIPQYNEGKPHQPINKVRIFEIGSKFNVGQKGNKKSKYVEAAKGTNLFFAIYIDANNKRSFETIPLNVVIERQKQGLSPVPETNEKGHQLLFHLSPGDLVLIPNSNKEIKSPTENIYKMVSASLTQCFFLKNLISNSIVNKVEFTSLNKFEKNENGIMIKDVCEKIKINRLGQLS